MPLGDEHLLYVTTEVEADHSDDLRTIVIGLVDMINKSCCKIIHFQSSTKDSDELPVNYRSATLSELIEFRKASLLKITRDDNLIHLDSLRKHESIDPLNMWIGSYNLKRECLARFFKWLYNHDVTSKDTLVPLVVPLVMKNIPRLKRKEQSIYKPTDLWTKEEDFLFLKYCPSKRDRCYHSVSRDASARPHEILSINVRSVHFKLTADNKQYAEVLVNGKTGSRHIPHRFYPVPERLD